MFNVIVVDDEPTAVDYICTIIETKCSKFRVVDTANNAKDGLEKVYQHRPDLVITDIKMPIMNGIDFVKKIKEKLPDIHAIIVSGYQDFEYAKGAIQLGALDYVLKPINPTLLTNTLDSIAPKLNVTLAYNRNSLLRSISKGGSVSESEVQRCFPDNKYYAAIIRKNGLPRRFSNNSNLEIYSNEDEMIFLYGRDEMESLYICPEEILALPKFKDFINRTLKKGQYQEGYTTSIIVSKSFETKELFQVVKSLYKNLDSRIVIGCTQTIILDGGEIDVIHSSLEDIRRMEYIIRKERWDLIKAEFIGLMSKWAKEKCPQLWIERFVRQIFYSLQAHYKNSIVDEYEFMLEDAFYYAASIEELTESLLDVFHQSIRTDISYSLRDTKNLLESIKEYLNKHISEMITLQSVCKVFGITQPYLSKLFREYEEKSFNNYLTTIRINYAKKLMSENKEFFVKDIAAMVGYNDQFYFSRVFCSVTGSRPSTYAEMQRED